MPNFSTVEDTLFVPMLGRIYASETFPNILYDEKALSLKASLPKSVKGAKSQTQYTLLASAVRSTNMDRYIQQFIKEHPEGIIVQLGAGLETTFYRNDNGKTQWYEVDLPSVITYREKLLKAQPLDTCLTADAFSEEWIKDVRKDHPTCPILVTASGLFYYFEEEKVVTFLKRLKQYGHVELVFDTVNRQGMKRMAHYMKQVGHEDAKMYFYVDDVDVFTKQIGGVKGKEEAYYAYTKKKGFQLMTAISMLVSDYFHMVKMVHIHMNE